MIIKEMWAVLRDPKQRLVLILPPLMQLFIFAFATTLDVRNVDIGVMDMSGGVHAREIVQRIDGSPRFRKVVSFPSPQALQQAIDQQKVIAAIVLPPDFDRTIDNGKTATLGVVLDGRRSNAAQIVGGYVALIAGQVGAEIRAPLGASARASSNDAQGVIVTNWYNPSLDYKWFTIPSLVVMILSTSGIAITSQMVARERELGTFDQLMVSPLRVHEILIGKMVPPFFIGLANGSLFIIAGPLVFGVPFTGSILLFYLSLSLFLFALIGIGMLVSAISTTQQQAFLGAFVIINPVIILSGFASPIDNMPGWMQVITYANPARYAIVIMHGLFLKAMPAINVLNQLWPMLIIACVTLGAAAVMFRARME
jgi:ABC-2 type transport system permease protein